MKTYVYIDASNIRNALRSSNISINFPNLFKYLKAKYPNLASVKYFEGISSEDITKKELFKSYEVSGVDIRSLERKSYLNEAKYKIFTCNKCGEKESVETQKSAIAFKSNIDVYLCSELFGDAFPKNEEIHFVIFSCDGDYAEMIKKLLEIYPKSSVSVFATKYTKSNLYLSSRLQKLVGDYPGRYHLVNIENIKDKIK